MKAFVVFAACGLLASPALAQSMNGGPAAGGENSSGGNRTRTANRTATPADRNDGEVRVCRKLVVTGSNRPERVCLTREQWRRHGD